MCVGFIILEIVIESYYVTGVLSNVDELVSVSTLMSLYELWCKCTQTNLGSAHPGAVKSIYHSSSRLFFSFITFVFLLLTIS